MTSQYKALEDKVFINKKVFRYLKKGHIVALSQPSIRIKLIKNLSELLT